MNASWANNKGSTRNDRFKLAFIKKIAQFELVQTHHKWQQLIKTSAKWTKIKYANLADSLVRHLNEQPISSKVINYA